MKHRFAGEKTDDGGNSKNSFVARKVQEITRVTQIPSDLSQLTISYLYDLNDDEFLCITLPFTHEDVDCLQKYSKIEDIMEGKTKLEKTVRNLDSTLELVVPNDGTPPSLPLTIIQWISSNRTMSKKKSVTRLFLKIYRLFADPRGMIVRISNSAPYFGGIPLIVQWLYVIFRVNSELSALLQELNTLLVLDPFKVRLIHGELLRCRVSTETLHPDAREKLVQFLTHGSEVERKVIGWLRHKRWQYLTIFSQVLFFGIAEHRNEETQLLLSVGPSLWDHSLSIGLEAGWDNNEDLSSFDWDTVRTRLKDRM